MPFRFDERRLVLESKLHHCLVQIEFHALLHLHRVKKTEHALADGGHLADELRVAIFEYDVPARDDHHPVGLVRLQETSQSTEPFL